MSVAIGSRGSTTALGRIGVPALLAAALVLGACGDADLEVVDDVPVAAAEAVGFDESPLTDPAAPALGSDEADPADVPEDGATPSPAPSSSSTIEIGPSSADAAAFVRGDALTDLRDVEHAVVDLDADTWPEVVATGIHDRVGVVRVAWWTADGYEVLAEARGGPGTDVTDLRAADLNADGRVELLVRVEGDGRGSLALWRVLRRGVIEPLPAVGGCHDGSHVYGVTRARLEDGGGAPTLVADCDDSPLPVADWSEQRWVWRDGAYRVDPTSLPGADDGDETVPDASTDDGGDGAGHDGGGLGARGPGAGEATDS